MYLGNNSPNNDIRLPKLFCHVVTLGKLSHAIKINYNPSCKGILYIDEQIINLLNEKHPNASKSDHNILVN